MSITLSLATPAERAAALSALMTYIDALDGNGDRHTLPLFPVAEPTPVTIAPEDNPEVGIVVPPNPAAIVETPPLPYLGLANPGVEFDSKGVAWSAELHAGNKSKNKDGSWRAKRNASGATDDAPEAPPAPVAPPVPAAPPAVPVPAPAASSAPTTAQEFTKAIMPLIQTGKLTAAQVTEACALAGVANLPALSASPAAVPTVWANLQMLAGI